MTFSGPLLTSPLVSTQWLADHLGSDNLIILDASVLVVAADHGPRMLSGASQYRTNGHVPGAIFADLLLSFSDASGLLPLTTPDVEQFATAAGALGVGPASTVVIYDTAVDQWSARLWWLFRRFNFDTVAVLDGGFAKWRIEEREVAFGGVETIPTVFSAVGRHDLWPESEHEGPSAVVTEATTIGNPLFRGLTPKEFVLETDARSLAALEQPSTANRMMRA